MFRIFKKKETSVLFAPVTGKAIALSNVPDQMFADKMMGDGIAFELDDKVICAPCDGEITMVATTLHAIGITANNGAEILIHIGLDTVELGGKGFKQLVSVGDKVKMGTPLIEIDIKYMEEKNIKLTTPMVVTNSSDYTLIIKQEESHVTVGEDKVILFE